MNQFEQPKTGEKEEHLRTAFEGREGKKFFIESLDAKSPDLNKVQDILEKGFEKSEIDPFEVLQKAVAEEGYHVHAAKDIEGKIQGIFNSGVVEMMNDKGKALKGCMHFWGHVFTEPSERGQDILKNLSKEAYETAFKDAEEQGLRMKGSVAEVHGNVEKTFNELGLKRVYVKTKEGDYVEAPYEQPPIEYDKETGKPVETARIVPEHLMLKLESGKNTLSNKELMRMVNGVYDYNYYQEEDYFKNPKAYEAHNEIVDGVKEKFADFVGDNEIHLLSAEERKQMQSQGVKFVEHRQKEDRAEAVAIKRAEKSGQKKEWMEHFGEEAKMQLEVEKAERKTQKSEKEWEKQFGILAEIEKEKEALKSAEIPKEGMKVEDILKEAGAEKKSAAFDEFQKGLDEKLEQAKTLKGEKISDGDKLLMARKDYLDKLEGYSVKYKGLLRDKIEIRDENNKVVKEFGSFYFSRTERQVNDFLKEKVRERLEGKKEQPEKIPITHDDITLEEFTARVNKEQAAREESGKMDEKLGESSRKNTEGFIGSIGNMLKKQKILNFLESFFLDNKKEK